MLLLPLGVGARQVHHPQVVAKAGIGFLALRQYVEMLLRLLPSKTAQTKPWKLTVQRDRLVPDALRHFSPASPADQRARLYPWPSRDR